MERWDIEFELFKKFDVMPSTSECEWIKQQRKKGSRGLMSKVNFAAEHNKGNTHWKKGLMN